MSRQEELNEMQKKHDEEARKGGYVYPVYEGIMPHEKQGRHLGIIRRDWLAGLAMQGELSSQDGSEENDWIKLEVLAERSYMIADAMIAESNK